MAKNCVYCGKPLSSPTDLMCVDCIKTSTSLPASAEKPKTFVKADEGKLEWSLMPFKELEEVVKILQFGARKYSLDNWKKCDNWKRYEDAAMRHLVSYIKGEHTDPESGKSHMAHLICNALFLMWHDNQTAEQEKEDQALAEEFIRLRGESND